MYALVVVEGPDTGARHPLPDREPQLIGRSTEAIPLRDDSVSRRHAELTPDDGRWWLRDLDSTNGTLLNGELLLDRVALSAGDRIQCGDTVLLVSHIDESDLHGRLRSPDPDRHDIRLLDPPVDSGTDRWRNLLDPSRDGPAALAETLAQLLGADQAAIVPINDRGVLRGLPEVRNQHGDPAETAFDLPRNLVAQVADPTVIGKPRVAVIDGTTAVAAVVIGENRHRHIVALSRPADPGWDEESLSILVDAASVVDLRLHVGDGLMTAARLERLAAMGEATAALSHSIKNILQGMRGGADAIELALDRERIDLARQGWAILARNLDRILALSLNMLAYSKDRGLDLTPTIVGRLAREAAESLESTIARRKIQLERIEDPDEPPIPIDPDAIHQVLLNLLGNAIDAVPDGGRIQIKTRYMDREDLVEVLVQDDGPGIPVDRRLRIFEPFYSTKGQRGTGLGLAVAQKLAERHGGALTAGSSDILGGACLRMTLPVTLEGEMDASDTRGPNPIQGGDLGVRFDG
ncbi:MAG: hypothetical protein CMJ67_05340 [Planctomycetaceae bacterium]|nr:hypothetical protein [Planctomycetaceae bacterium]